MGSPLAVRLRITAFGIRICFGFRDSDFGFSRSRNRVGRGIPRQYVPYSRLEAWCSFRVFRVFRGSTGSGTEPALGEPGRFVAVGPGNVQKN
jgi:hypothetical protein